MFKNQERVCRFFPLFEPNNRLSQMGAKCFRPHSFRVLVVSASKDPGHAQFLFRPNRVWLWMLQSWYEGTHST